MIRRVKLRSWKAFSELDLVLPPGTSFVVARNGVGKTSLLQALYFGLFGHSTLLGSTTGIEQAVRGGAHVASVQLEVEIAGREWTITRTVHGTPRRREAAQNSSVEVDGSAVSLTDWEAALEDSSGVSITELRLLSAIAEGDTISLDRSNGERYDIVRHLSHVLGVSQLRETAVRFADYSKRTAKQADRDRLTLRDRPARSSSERQRQLVTEQEPLEEQLHEVREALQSIRTRVMSAQVWRQWEREDRDQRAAAHRNGDLIAQAITAATADLPPTLQDRLLRNKDPRWLESGVIQDEYEHAHIYTERATELLSRLRELRDIFQRDLGAHRAHVELAEQALRLLDEAGPVCPTCRRPLAAGEADRARAEHLELRAEASRQVDENQAMLDKLSAAERAMGDAERPPPDPPPVPDVPRTAETWEDLKEHEESLAAKERHLDDRLRQIEASLQNLIQEAAEQQSADKLSGQLTTAYRRADLATIAERTCTNLADAICSERIEPLAETLAKRWSELWPGRPALRLDTTSGRLSGEAAGRRIDLADLSGGERAVATVLMRLLALQSASRSPILLLDEPLEHLDPHNRRLLASLLVAASDHERHPRQILVTTYEETVARRFRTEMEGEPRAGVVYAAAILQNDPQSASFL